MTDYIDPEQMREAAVLMNIVISAIEEKTLDRNDLLEGLGHLRDDVQFARGRTIGVSRDLVITVLEEAAKKVHSLSESDYEELLNTVLALRSKLEFLGGVDGDADHHVTPLQSMEAGLSKVEADMSKVEAAAELADMAGEDIPDDAVSRRTLVAILALLAMNEGPTEKGHSFLRLAEDIKEMPNFEELVEYRKGRVSS